jgi:Spy/CpxP family protein refolding chaperone
MKNQLSIIRTLVVAASLAVATFVNVEQKILAAEASPDTAHKNHQPASQTGSQAAVGQPNPTAGPPRIRAMANTGSAKSTQDGMSGMKGTSGAKQSQGMDKAMGNDAMNVMGAMPGGAMAQSAVPGVPGVSHLYHIGAVGFFLDHQEHIQLSAEQKKKFNQIRENALLEKATADRNVEEAEQQLWKLTAADQPDLAQIEAKVREIEKLRGDQRLTLVRPVVEAAKVLTEEQTKILLGTAAPVMADMPAAKSTTPGGKPAEKPAAKPEHKH